LDIVFKNLLIFFESFSPEAGRIMLAINLSWYNLNALPIICRVLVLLLGREKKQTPLQLGESKLSVNMFTFTIKGNFPFLNCVVINCLSFLDVLQSIYLAQFFIYVFITSVNFLPSF